jgi:hypothetical protein
MLFTTHHSSPSEEISNNKDPTHGTIRSMIRQCGLPKERFD